MLIIHYVNQIKRVNSHEEIEIFIEHFKIMFYNGLDFNKDKDHIMQWNSEY